MSRIDELIQEKCANGVKFCPLGDVAELKRGGTITKNEANAAGSIPVVAGGRTAAYYHDQSNRNGPVIVVAGSGAYAGFVSWWPTPIWVSDAFSVVAKKDALLDKFVFYFLLSKQDWLHSQKSGGGVPHVYPKDVAKIQVPLPPLEVQREIVRILDAFTELEAGLEAELEARKKQYEYYRNQLLTFKQGGVRLIPMGELVNNVRPPFSINRPDYGQSGRYPIIDQGQSFIAGYVDDEESLLPSGEYVVFGDHTRTVKYVNFPFAQGADGLQILRTKDHINAKYFFHAMSASKMPNRGYNRHWSLVKNMEIPVPDLTKQVEIVEILDYFESLVSDITIGLPAELKARRQQYEYYRDRLLSFKELDAA